MYDDEWMNECLFPMKWFKYIRMNTNLITWEEDYRNPHGLLQSSPPFVTIIKKNTFNLYQSGSKITVVRFYTCTILTSL